MIKNALLERGPKNSGMGRPPPLIRAMPERKRFFPLMSSLTYSLEIILAAEYVVHVQSNDKRKETGKVVQSSQYTMF